MNHEEALRKAMACLRLSKSANPNEAALAASKAQEIIDKFKLDVTGMDYEAEERLRDAEPIVDFGGDPLDDGTEREKRWALSLASVVARVNQCRVYYAGKFDHGRRISIVGRPSDVQTARYVFAFIKRQVLELAKDACAGHSGTYWRHYCIGVVDTVGQRLRDQQLKTFGEERSRHAANPMALVKVNGAIVKLERKLEAVDKWFDDARKNNRLRNGHSGGGLSYSGGRSEGQRDGHKVRLTQARAGIGIGTKQLN